MVIIVTNGHLSIASNIITTGLDEQRSLKTVFLRNLSQMRTLLKYLRPYRWLIVLALALAAINQSFSMLDPYFFGKIMDTYGVHPFERGEYNAKKVFTRTGTRTTA